MLRNLPLCLALIAFALPTVGQASPRIQTDLPIYDLRQMVTRYSSGAASKELNVTTFLENSNLELNSTLAGSATLDISRI